MVCLIGKCWQPLTLYLIVVWISWTFKAKVGINNYQKGEKEPQKYKDINRNFRRFVSQVHALRIMSRLCTQKNKEVSLI